ncbi:DUF349 domain-containing protein [Actinomyces bowdenii]|uniref:DUF349 domain-containing protein n=1 Tax=Actinomyces bowdenii TaxID=131109 RepID=A0A3P1V8P3_9ACTO|nr:DUF349 domain-containing protein [Actinomyces bowdenii]
MTEQNQPSSELNPTAASTAQAQDPAIDDATSNSGTSAPLTASPAEPPAEAQAAAPATEAGPQDPESPEPPADRAQEASAPTAADEPAQDDGAPGPSQGTARAEESPTAEPAPEQDSPEGQGASAAPGEAGAPAPAAASTTATAPETPVDPQEAMDAAKWGRVDGEGRVFVQDGGAEREVGQFPDAPVAEAMAFYVRRYLDLKATIDLFATRLPHLSVREIDSTLKSIEESLAQPAAVGDLEGLRARFAALRTVAAERRAAVAAERAAAKEQALKDRTAIVERAEAIAAQDPARTQWKNSGAELRELLETWKEAQRRGPRLDRGSEDGLWKRFSHARTTFDRHRRQFFSELDAKQSKVKAAKEALIKRAEEIQHSTDWAGTSAKYRDLMAEWKRAGRASRKEDDALWARFRAAQQVFFDARRAKDEAVDAEFAENLKVKEALVAKAEALLPIKDVKAAKKALRPIQDAWEEAGRVPRSAMRRIEGRMRAVEDAIREAENAEWRRTDPETKARAEGLAGQLEDAIASLEKDLQEAQASGDAKKVAEAEAALTARRAWLDQVRRSAKA